MIEDAAKHGSVVGPGDDGAIYEIVEFIPGGLKARGSGVGRSSAASPSAKPGAEGTIRKFRDRIAGGGARIVYGEAKTASGAFRRSPVTGGILTKIVMADRPESLLVEGEARLRRVDDDAPGSRGITAEGAVEPLALAVVEAEISAAKLRMELDGRLGRTTPDWVLQVAGQQAQPKPS